MNTEPFVLCDNLVKIYKVADLEVVALQGLDLEVHPGEVMALVGPSGAGKSTLLNVIGGLDVPSAGAVQVAGWDLLKMNQKDRVQYKRQVVGFVWQQPARNLLPYLTARENVEMPMSLAGVSGGKRRRRAMELLDVVGLAERADFRPDRLSGGEQQRVALSVALANNPPLLLGDELTGQIDSQSAAEVFAALRRINQAYGTTIIAVTHDPFIAGIVDRLVLHGMIERVSDPQDRRVQCLVVNDKGKALLANIKQKVIKEIHDVLKTLSDEELSALVQGLSALIRAAKIYLQSQYREMDATVSLPAR